LKAHFTAHPLYTDDQFLGMVTKTLLDSGHTVFQLFQYPENEYEHSVMLLRLADPCWRAHRILSLGCGVGGMEAHWLAHRPELRFELVNISQEQLDMCVCEGRKVKADAETYRSDQAPFDMVVMAYVLGHVVAKAALESAIANLAEHGVLLIYDVFDGTPKFDRELIYKSPSRSELVEWAYAKNLKCRVSVANEIPMTPFFAQTHLWAANQVTPALLVCEK
jgi:SAM-dependent methyltransferase